MTCKHIPVAPAGQIYCLICGKPLTSNDFPASAPEEAPPISEEWGHIGLALALAFEEVMQQDPAPINREYCWHHIGPGMGGWCCKHPECRIEEQGYEHEL